MNDSAFLICKFCKNFYPAKGKDKWDYCSLDTKNKRVKDGYSCINHELDENKVKAWKKEKEKAINAEDKKKEQQKERIRNKTINTDLGYAILIDQYQQNVNLFYKHNPFFYDKSKIFWFWNKELCLYEMVDETDVMNMFDDLLGLRGQTVNSKLKQQYLEAFKRVGRKHIPEEPKKQWIQFKDKAISLSSGKTYDVTHHYFFTNPIPWQLGETDETPVMDKLITDWVGEEYTQSVYELIAYCCYPDYPIQLIFCLYGSGRNGKTCLLKLISKFLGQNNICSTDLNLISGRNKSRFEVFKLFKKLVCLMGETNFSSLDDTALMKKLVGGDSIGFEKKGKDPFDAYSYAKILIASNSLPSSNDTSEGFYRRWMIIPFPNEFPEGKDILESIPEQEYNNLAKKIIKILKPLLEAGKFHNQGTILQRKERYIMVSNPLPHFLASCCVLDPDVYVSYSELYTAYVAYLRANKKRRVSRKEFINSLEDEGYWIDKTSKSVNDGEYKIDRWIDGINLKSDWKAHFDNFDIFPQIATRKLYIENELQNTEKKQNCQNNGLTAEEELIIDAKPAKNGENR